MEVERGVRLFGKNPSLPLHLPSPFTQLGSRKGKLCFVWAKGTGPDSVCHPSHLMAQINPYEWKSQMLMTKQESQAQLHTLVHGQAGALLVQCPAQIFSSESRHKVWSCTPVYPSASLGWRDGNHLRSLSLQQTPTVSAKDQLCGGIQRPLEQALQRVKIILGTPQKGCYFLIHWSFFRDCSTVGTEIIKS